MKILLPFVLFSVLLLPTAYAADVFVFSSPENSYSALSQFVGSENSLDISVYEFTSPEIADLISKKAQNLLVEGSPVGGIKESEEKILCNLKDKGIKIRLDKSKNFLHAKYIVGTKSVLVSSENFGQGFFENRGWGAIVEDEKIKKEFEKTFNEDFKNSVNFECKLKNYKLEPEKSLPLGEIKKFTDQNVESVFSPENAVQKILDLLHSANKSIYIEQFYIYKNWGSKSNPKPNLFLDKVLERAKQGVDVKILLDSNSYNIKESDTNSNINTANFVNSFSRQNNLTLEAKLADLEKLNLDKVHNKGIIIDEKTVFVSSINWNENSPKRNRETGIIISGKAAEYFVELFKKDFNGNSTESKNTELTGKIIAKGTDLVIIIVITITIYGAFNYFRRSKKHFT